MVTKAIEMAVFFLLVVLAIVNKIGVYMTKRRRQRICWLHKRKVVLGIDKNIDISNDLYSPKSILKMHNSGTDLSEENDRLKFYALAAEEDYFGRIKNNYDK